MLDHVVADRYCEYSASLQQSIESFATACRERGFAESREFSLPEGEKLPPEVLRDLSVCLCLLLNISFVSPLFLSRVEPERFSFVAIRTWMNFCLLWTKSRPSASFLSFYNLDSIRTTTPSTLSLCRLRRTRRSDVSSTCSSSRNTPSFGPPRINRASFSQPGVFASLPRVT